MQKIKTKQQLNLKQTRGQHLQVKQQWPETTTNLAQALATKLEPQWNRELNLVDLAVPGEQFLKIESSRTARKRPL